MHLIREALLTRLESKRSRRSAIPSPDIPEKLYFRIGEVARLLGVAPFVLRFWESEFPQLKPGKGGTGQRLYRRRDVETAFHIRSLLYEEGYTIPGARQLLQSGSTHRQTQVMVQPSPPSPASLRRLRQELQEIAGILSRPVLPRQANAGTRAISGKRNRSTPEEPLPLFARQHHE